MKKFFNETLPIVVAFVGILLLGVTMTLLSK